MPMEASRRSSMTVDCPDMHLALFRCAGGAVHATGYGSFSIEYQARLSAQPWLPGQIFEPGSLGVRMILNRHASRAGCKSASWRAAHR